MRSSLVLETTHDALRQLRPWLTESIGTFDDELIGTIELAVHEVATNIVDHSDTAGRTLAIHLERDDRAVRFELRDSGRLVRLPTETDLEPHPRVGGYGMVIVGLLASRVRYERVGSENVWSIDFDLDPT